jgi:acetyl-CoA carboxylase carboxyltransferase component
MLSSKIRTAIITLVASACFGGAAFLPAVSHAAVQAEECHLSASSPETPAPEACNGGAFYGETEKGELTAPGGEKTAEERAGVSPYKEPEFRKGPAPTEAEPRCTAYLARRHLCG